MHNSWIILFIILFFTILIFHNIFYVESLDNQHYVESNNLVNSSCHSFYDRQYIVDNTTNEFTKNEYSVNVHSKTKKYCIAPASYNDCNDSCECPEGYIYDSQVGCVTSDYYIPITTPPPTPTPTQPILPPSEAPLPKKSCPPGYVYDPYIDRCLSICLRDEYYEPKTGNCVKDCSFSWGKWSDCNYEGTKTRDPIIYIKANENGIQCPVRETSNCIIDCSYSWGNWTDCDVKTGTKSRDPIIYIKANKPGKQCPVREISDCLVDCNYTWSDWPECDVNTGYHTRTLTIHNPSWNGGATCPPKTETEKCDVNCNYTWSDWSDCDASGEKSRELKILNDSWNDGRQCPAKYTEKRKCTENCQYELINKICNAKDGYYYYTIDMKKEGKNKNCYYDSYDGQILVSRNQSVKSKEQCMVDCEYDLINPVCNKDDHYLHYTVKMNRNSMNGKCYYNGEEIYDGKQIKSVKKCIRDDSDELKLCHECSYSISDKKCDSNSVMQGTLNLPQETIDGNCLNDSPYPNNSNGDRVDAGLCNKVNRWEHCDINSICAISGNEQTYCRVGDNRCLTNGDCSWANGQDGTNRDCTCMKKDSNGNCIP